MPTRRGVIAFALALPVLLAGGYLLPRGFNGQNAQLRSQNAQLRRHIADLERQAQPYQAQLAERNKQIAALQAEHAATLDGLQKLVQDTERRARLLNSPAAILRQWRRLSACAGVSFLRPDYLEQENAQLQQELARLKQHIPPSGGTPPPPRSSPLEPRRAPGDTSPAVYSTEHGDKYHTIHCGNLWNSCIPMTLNDAKRLGKEACQKCNSPL